MTTQPEDVHENRRAHLTLLVAAARRQADVSSELGLNSPRYISALLSGSRKMGHHFARKLERQYGLPRYAIDSPTAELTLEHKLSHLPDSIRSGVVLLIDTLFRECIARPALPEDKD